MLFWLVISRMCVDYFLSLHNPLLDQFIRTDGCVQLRLSHQALEMKDPEARLCDVGINKATCVVQAAFPGLLSCWCSAAASLLVILCWLFPISP